MNIIIKFKNLKISESFKKFIEDKIGSVKKFLKSFNKNAGGQDDSMEAFVEVERETKHHRKGNIFKAEAKVTVPGKSFMAEAHGEDLGKAVTKVKGELEREIRKYKTKTFESPRRKERKSKKFFKSWGSDDNLES